MQKIEKKIGKNVENRKKLCKNFSIKRGIKYKKLIKYHYKN